MSTSSREGSPDWLRSYQAPTTTSLLSLSSSDEDDGSLYKESETISSLPVTDDVDSDVSVEEEESLAEFLSRKNSETKVVSKQPSIEQVFSRRKKVDASVNLEGKVNGNNVEGEGISSKEKDSQGEDDSVWLLSSDSEPPSSDPTRQQVTMSAEKEEDFDIQAKEGEPAVKKAPKKKSPKKKLSSQTPKEENSEQEILKSEDIDTDAVVAEEVVTTDKTIKPSSGSNSRLPLVLSEKVNRTKVLVECEGDSIDLSGDMGAVGRVVVSDTTEDVYLDLKGTIYKTTIVPSRTFCIVNIGQSEAKIEAIMNDFIQLTPQSNVYEAETMVEGTLEGYSFDSDDEANKNAKTASKPADQSGGVEEVTDINGKGKGKAKAKAKSENVVGKKRGRPSKEKQPPAKKAKSSAPKKSKPKK